MHLSGPLDVTSRENTVKIRLFARRYFGPDLRRRAQIAQPDKP